MSYFVDENALLGQIRWQMSCGPAKTAPQEIATLLPELLGDWPQANDGYYWGQILVYVTEHLDTIGQDLLGEMLTKGLTVVFKDKPTDAVLRSHLLLLSNDRVHKHCIDLVNRLYNYLHGWYKVQENTVHIPPVRDIDVGHSSTMSGDHAIATELGDDFDKETRRACITFLRTPPYWIAAVMNRYVIEKKSTGEFYGLAKHIESMPETWYRRMWHRANGLRFNELDAYYATKFQ